MTEGWGADPGSEQLPIDIRNRAMWLHLAGFGSVLLGYVVYYFALLLPYWSWRSPRNQHPFVEENGRNATNFHISVAVYATILWLIMALVAFSICSSLYGGGAIDSSTVHDWLGIFGLVMLAYGISQPLFCLGCSAYGAIRARQGYVYRYPITIEFLKPPKPYH